MRKDNKNPREIIQDYCSTQRNLYDKRYPSPLKTFMMTALLYSFSIMQDIGPLKVISGRGPLSKTSHYSEHGQLEIVEHTFSKA